MRWSFLSFPFKYTVTGFMALLLMMPGLYFRLSAQVKTVTYYADPASVPPDLIAGLRHIEAHLRFTPEENLVIGEAEMTIVPNRYQTDSVVFQCPDFKVFTVKIDGTLVSFRMNGLALVIYPDGEQKKALVKGREAKIRIEYESRPQAGPIYFVGWTKEEEGKRKVIWAHRPNGWLPYMESRVMMDLFITFDERYNVFSNGERISVTGNPDGTKTWHYSMKNDHPFFSTCVVIGDYQFQQSTTACGVPLELWYYSDVPGKVATTYKYTEEMFSFFEHEMGVNYPYPVYRQAPVIDYMYGGMETTTATVFGDFMLIDPRAWWQRNYVNVNAHELAHQWFGNYVAHLVNKDVWLTESFGTYYAKLFEKHIYGEDQFQNVRNEEILLSLEAAKRNDFPVGGSRGGVERIYRKGSLVLDMLRDVMGDREFRDAIRLYLERYGFAYAETNDLLRCTYDVTGKPYGWFFDQWILRGGEPHYKVSYTISADSTGRRFTRVDIAQVQQTGELTGLFRMPVVVEVHYADGSVDSQLVWIGSKENTVNILNPAKKNVAFVLFDPGRRILKKLTFERNFDELAAQAMAAPAMVDRLDALIALDSVTFDKKRDLLVKSFRKEHFVLIKTEIIRQMAANQEAANLMLIGEALGDRDADIRKAALLGMRIVPESLRSSVEAMLFDSSYLNVGLALEKLCTSFPGRTRQYLDLTKDMEGWRGKNIRMKWLEITIAGGQKDYLDELIGYAGPRYEFETRMNAFGVLQRLKYADTKTLDFARQASKHWNNKLSAVAKEYLKHWK